MRWLFPDPSVYMQKCELSAVRFRLASALSGAICIVNLGAHVGFTGVGSESDWAYLLDHFERTLISSQKLLSPPFDFPSKVESMHVNYYLNPFPEFL